MVLLLFYYYYYSFLYPLSFLNIIIYIIHFIIYLKYHISDSNKFYCCVSQYIHYFTNFFKLLYLFIYFKKKELISKITPCFVDAKRNVH